MNFIKKIVEFFKNIFKRQENIKMLEESKGNAINEDKTKFINSLKVNTVNKKKTKVETLTCFGDGLGIQNKISY